MGGLSSMSGDKLLESGGMFYVNARQDGKTVKINPEQGIYTEVPTDEVNPNMQLFEGKRMENGSIDWINPTPLEKFLTPVDINSLNFYPPKYEPKLAELGQDVTNKKYKDSLYYSFAWEDKQKECFKVGDYEDDLTEGARKGFLGKNTNIESYVSQISCDEFEISFIIGMRTTQSFSPSRVESFDIDINDNSGKIGKSDITLIGSSVVSNAVSSNIRNEHAEFFASEYKNVKLITQKIKVKSTGVCGLKLPVYPEGYEVVEAIDLAVWFEKEQLIVFDTTYKSVELVPDSLLGKEDVALEMGLILRDTLIEEVVSEGANVAQFGINPAKIKTIWSKEFNKTLIATREFEERLKTIFGTCNDKVLDLYINNLNLDLYVIDSMAANMSSGNSRNEFLKFAERKDGKVQIDERRMKKLQKHYTEKQKIIAAAIAKTKAKFDKENKQLDEKAGKERTKHSQDEVKRKQDNFTEEFNLNLTEAYRQLGKPKPDRLDAKDIYKLRLKTGGWKNVDAYVMESLDNRETLDYTDPTTGKKAVIQYNPINITIKDETKFDRLLVYILPDKLNSFMRVEKSNLSYTEKLNELMNHNLVCLGYIGEQAYFYSKDNVTPKEYNNVELLPLSQQELKHNLNRYDNTQRKSLLKDFDYQLFEIKEQQRQDILIARQHLREEIMPAIFPCGIITIIEDNVNVNTESTQPQVIPSSR